MEGEEVSVVGAVDDRAVVGQVLGQLRLDVCRIRSHADMAPMEQESNVTLPAMSST